MNLARTRSSVVLGLFVCSAALGSVRLDGLGSGLLDIIEDPVADMTRYPQLNVLAPGWLVGVEMNQTGHYRPYARTSGRWSVAAALDATLKDTRVYCDPSLALATQAGPVSLGVSATADFLDEPIVPPKRDSPPWIYAVRIREVGEAVIGARWYGRGFTLDGSVRGYEWEAFDWRPSGDSAVLVDRHEHPSLTSSLRMTWPGKHLNWRGIVDYAYVDEVGVIGYGLTDKHSVSLSGGTAFATATLLAAGGLRVAASDLTYYWTWNLRLPVGIEWSPGPVTLRLGADAAVSFATAKPTYRGFKGHTYVGLGLRPVERLRLDFVPDMDDAANLRGWELAASYEF
jgi:hypothetical protein